jgi:osmotically-inducible protein OsmY
MLKKIFKNLFWIALPLGLAMGCAENRPQAEAAYGPGPSTMLEPTSAQPEQHIYSNSGSADEGANAQFNEAPSGATSTKWSIAEEIQQKLTADTTLAPLGSSLVAEVGKDGNVTLRGTVSSRSEEKRVCDSIASLPGVQGVNNQLSIGRVFGDSTLNMRQSD